MPRKKLKGELPEEVLAVCESRQILSPARNSLEHIEQFAWHVNDRTSGQCLTLSHQWDKELRMMRFARWQELS